MSKKIRVMVEGAVMAALAFGLSMVRLFRFPWSGSITLLSMLPIIVFSIRNGVKSGLACSLVYSLTQLAQGIFAEGLLGWGLTPAMLATCIFLDYVGAFTTLGLAGMFRKHDLKGWITGSVLAILIRYTLHVISGAVVFASAGMLWEGLQIDNTWLYSMAYNACYMLPEMILTTSGAAVLFKTGAIKMILKGADIKAA